MSGYNNGDNDGDWTGSHDQSAHRSRTGEDQDLVGGETRYFGCLRVDCELDFIEMGVKKREPNMSENRK